LKINLKMNLLIITWSLSLYKMNGRPVRSEEGDRGGLRIYPTTKCIYETKRRPDHALHTPQSTSVFSASVGNPEMLWAAPDYPYSIASVP
jgi:hypothetical protein